MLWGRCARFARLVLLDYGVFLLEQERAMIRRLGETRPAEEVLEELRRDPRFVRFEQQEQARSDELDRQVDALPLFEQLDLGVLMEMATKSYVEHPRCLHAATDGENGEKT